ncbi:MAG: hypothetical protein J5998_00325 [Clostridia bacterium]|nr:hypothetical protein [Clostridia bacterium]
MFFEFSFGSAHPARVDHNEEETRFTALADSDDAGYWVSYELNAPIGDSYVMIPACAYDGNRFEAVRRKYPPMFLESEMGLNPPTRMTEVPRLSPQGDSRMDVTTGDMAAPCVCVLNKAGQEAFLLFTGQGAHGLNFGVTLEQIGDRLRVTLRAPARRKLVYRWYEGYPSLRENPEADAPMTIREGEETVIPHRVYAAPCEDIPALYRLFFEKRSDLFTGGAEACLPFSAFWEMTEAEMNRNHFEEKEGFYALNALDGRDTSKFGQWQCGWVGGGMTTFPLIVEGSDLSRERSIKTLLFAGRYQSKAGWFYGIVFGGKVYHDCFGYYEEKYYLILVRKHADLVYLMFKQIEALRRMKLDVPREIERSAIAGADALVSLWKRYGQLGQFINAETGEIVVGNSTSGAIAPAALCAAALVTGDAVYMEAAKEIGEFYDRTATRAGVTTGGPGEILQAPDSESAAALLESYVALYEACVEDKWLRRACDAAHQMASWVVAYDYEFPKDSRFGRMGIRTAGSVWANVQNKHSAPGMCTASPAPFLKLFRYTGDERYLRLMREIAHYMPQSASYPARPMRTVRGDELMPGEMCERVNLSDWEGNHNVGDSIFGSSSWPQTSLMLTCLEVPGVYVLKERGIVSVSDHVNAWLEDGQLCIQNPTAMSATVKVMVDTEESLAEKLGLFYQERFRKVSVAPGALVKLRV